MNSSQKTSIVFFLLSVIVASIFYIIPINDIFNLINGKHFAINLTSTISNSTQFQTILLKNISTNDAINVNIKWVAFGPVEKISDTCTYAKFTKSEYSNDDLLISFNKMPSNYECSINVKTSFDNTESFATIAADGINSEKWDSSSFEETMQRETMLIVIIGITIIGGTFLMLRRDSQRAISYVDHESLDYDQLREKYGFGFEDDDKLIMEAIGKGKMTDEDITIFTQLHKKYVRKRMEFMAKKGIFSLD